MVIGDLTRYGMPKPDVMPYSTRRVPTIDVGFVDALKSGRVTVRAAVERLTPNGAIFADGASGSLFQRLHSQPPRSSVRGEHVVAPSGTKPRTLSRPPGRTRSRVSLTGRCRRACAVPNEFQPLQRNSRRTMYRLLDAASEIKQRRDQVRRPRRLTIVAPVDLKAPLTSRSVLRQEVAMRSSVFSSHLLVRV